MVSEAPAWLLSCIEAEVAVDATSEDSYNMLGSLQPALPSLLGTLQPGPWSSTVRMWVWLRQRAGAVDLKSIWNKTKCNVKVLLDSTGSELK